MPLFQDGPPSDIDDLVAQDSQLPDVTNGENIDTTRKLVLAYEQLGIEIRALLDRYSPGPSLMKVAVTAPLKTWHTYRTLDLIYTDAFFSALSDRYHEKRDQFRALALSAGERVIEAGVGIVHDPLPHPAPPVLAQAGGLLQAGWYFATMAWLNSRGEESSPAHPDTISLVTGSFSVTPTAPPVNATAWNVYAGLGPDSMVIQNAPIAIGSVWTQAAALRTSGRGPGSGQEANYFAPVPRFLQRG